ncbi:MAG: cyclodeaminase/cyclohydrolase family protein [Nocardioidaceae bacterium]
MVVTASYLDDRLGDFLDQVAKREPAPGGGAVAAVTMSLATALVAMAARFSAHQLADGDQLVEEAERLRQRVAGLADDDAHAYQAVIAVHRSSRDDSTNRQEAIRDALTARCPGAARSRRDRSRGRPTGLAARRRGQARCQR